jgi:FecR-like protein
MTRSQRPRRNRGRRWVLVGCLVPLVVFQTALPVSAQTDDQPPPDGQKLEWTGDLTLIGALDKFGPPAKITIARTPGTDEFTMSAAAGYSVTVTIAEVGDCVAPSLITFEGTGTFDELRTGLVFTGTLVVDNEHLCDIQAAEDFTRENWEIFVSITETGLTGVFGPGPETVLGDFWYSMPGVPLPVGTEDVAPSEATDVPDDFEGDEELEPAPPVVPGECFLAPNSSRDIIGVITAASGQVEIQRDVFGDFEVVDPGSIDTQADPSLVASTFLVRQGDIVRVRSDSLARMTYFEKSIPLARLADSQGTELSALLEAGTTEIDILPDSVVCLSEDLDQSEQPTSILDLLSGAFRWTSNSWASGGFSARAGTTVIGRRGTEFIVGFDANSREATVLVNDGSVEMLNAGDRLLVGAGSWAVSSDDLGFVVNPTAIEGGGFDTVLSSGRPLAAIADLADHGDSGSLPLFGILVGAVVALALLAAGAAKLRSARTSTS